MYTETTAIHHDHTFERSLFQFHTHIIMWDGSGIYTYHKLLLLPIVNFERL